MCLTQCGCVSRVIDDPDESQEDIGFLLECWTVGVTSSHLELSVFTTVKLWIASKSGVCCQLSASVFPEDLVYFSKTNKDRVTAGRGGVAALGSCLGN